MNMSNKSNKTRSSNANASASACTKGGKNIEESQFLGEGSYGCVVKPPVPCKNKVKLRRENKNDNKVGKIFTENKAFQKEIATNKVAIKIDPTNKKLLTASSYCNVTQETIKKENRTRMCDLTYENANQKTFYQLNMPYGGVTLKSYFKHYQTDFSIFDLLKSLKNVFQTLIILDKKKVCHQDIKPDNILIKPNGEAIIIDYSLIIPFKKIYTPENRHRLKYAYYPYPPEYKLYDFIHFQKCYKYQYCNYIFDEYLNHSLSAFNISALGDNVITHLINHNLLLHHFNEIRDVMIAKDKSGGSGGGAGGIEKFMTKYANRVDIYSVGMTIMKTLKYVNYDLHNNEINEFLINIIHPNVIKRYTPKQAYTALVDLLKKYNMQ